MANTYYTILDYSGKGAFSNINIFQTNGHLNTITVKVTVDGGAPLEQLLGTNQTHNTICRNYAAAMDKLGILDWGLVSFETSLKVEYKSTNAERLVGTCFYQTYA